jgi:hypothetical protein
MQRRSPELLYKAYLGGRSTWTFRGSARGRATSNTSLGGQRSLVHIKRILAVASPLLRVANDMGNSSQFGTD